MAYSERLIERTAFDNFALPNTVTSNTAQSTQTGIYIPTGAIVTGIRFFAGTALTGMASFSNATIMPYIGAVALGTNNAKVSVVIIKTAAKTQEVVAADGILVKTGGYVDIDFGTTGAGGTGITGNADVYIDYLYCSDRDTS